MLRGENEEAPASEGLQPSSSLQRQSLETSRDVGNYPKSRKGLERRIVSGYAELGVLLSGKEAARFGAGGVSAGVYGAVVSLPAAPKLVVLQGSCASPGDGSLSPS